MTGRAIDSHAAKKPARWWMKGRHEPIRWWAARLLRGRVDLTGYGDGRIDCAPALQQAMKNHKHILLPSLQGWDRREEGERDA